ncbi:unnamed protein product [Tenebrio molitor]|jgi:hypothetical protein|nr:unnamed protein product [Tenebrio molitor]
MVPSETVIGIEIFRCNHGTPGPLRGHQRQDVVSASYSFFATPGNFQLCVARHDRHLFPFAIRHSDFRMQSASNEGISAVLLVRSDLSEELLWRPGLFTFSVSANGENYKWFSVKCR